MKPQHIRKQQPKQVKEVLTAPVSPKLQKLIAGLRLASQNKKEMK